MRPQRAAHHGFPLALLALTVLPLAFSFGLTPPARAQLATLVDDLNTTGPFEAASSFPNSFLEIDGRAVFFADTGPQQLGVWVTDGTPLGTEPLGPACSGSLEACTQLRATRVGRLVYWRERYLHRTDGTREGTMTLTDGSSEIAQPLLPVGERLLFLNAVQNGQGELWVTDGTLAGTSKLVGEVSNPSQQFLGASMGEVALFTRTDDFGARTLWRTDGTSAGTAEILPGQLREVGDVGPLVANGRVFFLAYDNRNVSQLWSSDGSAAGTRALTNFASSNWKSSLALTATTDDRLFFGVATNGGSELWSSDGTVAGTKRFASLTTTPEQGFYALLPLGEQVLLFASSPSVEASVWVTSPLPNPPRRLVRFDYAAGEEFLQTGAPVRIGDRALFTASYNFFEESQVWVTDGTTAGTKPLPLGFGDEVAGLLEVGGTAYVIASDSDAGNELFRTDGTPQGTRRLTSFIEPFALGFSAGCYSPLGSTGCDIGEFGTGLLLGANERGYGNELWLLGQTAAETRLVADLARNAPSSDPHQLGTLQESLLFSASDGNKTHVYHAEGNASGAAAELGEIGNPAATGVFYGDTLAYFLAQPEGQEAGLFVTDSSRAGTLRLTGFDSAQPRLSASSFFAVVGDTFFFTSEDDGAIDLWRSTGTPEGTLRRFEIGSLVQPVPGTGFAWNGELFFVGAEPGLGHRDLWKTDGTIPGTVKLSDLSALEGPFGREPPQYGLAGGRLIVSFRGGFGADAYLMATDGTSAGTEVLLDLFPQSSPLSKFVNLEGRAYFLSSWDSDFLALWVTDGTVAGTRRLRLFEPPLLGDLAAADFLEELDGRLFFVAPEGVPGPQIWSTSGSEADIRRETSLPGSSRLSPPRQLIRAGGRLFFTFDDGSHGRELWMLAESAVAGARLVHDLAPGPASSNPQELTVADNRLYFTADDGLHGRELWSLDLAANPTTCPPTDSGLCLQDNRFRVEIDWRDFQGNTGRGTPVPLTADTGYFWFFNPANVETIVKVLDGRPINEHFWTFYGALSNVEYTMTVTDAQTGLTQRYFNPSRQFASVGDTESFGPNGASLDSFTAPNQSLFESHEPIIDSLFARSTAGSCVPSSTRLCLNNGRFAVEARWTDFQGGSGVGMAEDLTADTGYFWFFRDTNVEVVLKVLDGRPLNGKFWVFYGALSNVEYTLTVTDTETGAIKTYFNPGRRFGSVGDTGAF